MESPNEHALMQDHAPMQSRMLQQRGLWIHFSQKVFQYISIYFNGLQLGQHMLQDAKSSELHYELVRHAISLQNAVLWRIFFAALIRCKGPEKRDGWNQFVLGCGIISNGEKWIGMLYTTGAMTNAKNVSRCERIQTDAKCGQVGKCTSPNIY